MERKRFAVALPKAERACVNALEQWERDHGNEQFLINDNPLRPLLDHQHNGTSNTTASTTHAVSTSIIGLSKAQSRKKSLRQVLKQVSELHMSKIHRDDGDGDTLEFTQLENIKHFNGVPRVRWKRIHVALVLTDLLP